MAADLDLLDARIAAQCRRDRVEHGIRLALDDRGRLREVHEVEHLERCIGDDDATAIGTAVVILVAVVGLGLVRTLVVAIEDAITSMMNAISSGSLMGVLKRTIDSAPSRPSESGSENWMQTKIAVIDRPSRGNARYTWLPVARDE